MLHLTEDIYLVSLRKGKSFRKKQENNQDKGGEDNELDEQN